MKRNDEDNKRVEWKKKKKEMYMHDWVVTMSVEGKRMSRMNFGILNNR